MFKYLRIEMLKQIRTHLKNVFWPNIFVGA
jgi:hypothetical protein